VLAHFEKRLELLIVTECFQECCGEGDLFLQYLAKTRLIIHQEGLHELIDEFSHLPLRAIEKLDLFHFGQIFCRSDHVFCPVFLEKPACPLQQQSPCNQDWPLEQRPDDLFPLFASALLAAELLNNPPGLQHRLQRFLRWRPS
jgi:hypothetical protein